ncbi:MAG: neutral/alkaline non-lysosomal ceramidase N-terminal domain-containing protein, partial [Candidatus Latescibacterota bacterium]
MNKMPACFLAAALLACFGCSDKSSLKVGVGETVITPQKNMQMAGFARSQVATGVHDDLHARSLVIEDAGGTAAVLMTVSIVGLTDEFAGRIREGITAKTGVPGESIVISCTHTHSGPAVGRDDSEAGKEYSEFLIQKCIESAVTAWESRAPGSIGIEPAEVFELGRNRRALLYGGVHPDPEVAVLKIQDSKGKLLGVAFNYGCHPTGLDWTNTEYSEDWPGYAIREIKKNVGENVWVAFFQGPEGNINVGYTAELSAVGAPMPVRSHWYIEKKGSQMAGAVLKALPGIPTSGEHLVKTAYDRFDYPMRESYPVTLVEAEINAKAAHVKLAALEQNPEFAKSKPLDKARVEVFSADQRLNAAKRFHAPDRALTRKNEQQAVRIGD